MRLFVKLLVNAFAVMVTAYLLPGVHVEGYFAAFVVVIVLGILNMIVKPILHILALPITIMTLGLFAIVVNAIVILLTARLVSGFSVDGFWWAVWFSIILWLVSWFFSKLATSRGQGEDWWKEGE